MATLTAGQSATVTINAGDTWTVTKTALSEGTFSVVNANGTIKDAGVFGNTALNTKIYGPYFTKLNNPGTPEATTLTIACTIGSITYVEVPAGGGGSGVNSLTTTGTAGAATLSAGVLNIPVYQGIGSVNLQTGTTYTLALTDKDSLVEMNNASANTLTVPANATVAFPLLSTIQVMQYGAGATSVAAAVGVTIRTVASLNLSAQYGIAQLTKIGTDEWFIVGNLQ